MTRRTGGWRRIAWAALGELFALMAVGMLKITGQLVEAARWARERARREHCHLCRMGSSAERRSCGMRIGNSDRCGLLAGAGAGA